MKPISALSLVVTFAGIVACASTAPPQALVNARTAYDRASRGPTKDLDPADLHLAKETLDRAEKSFAENGDGQETTDTAYTAERRTEIAETRARTTQIMQQKAQTTADMNASQTRAVQLTSAALGRANLQLATQDQALKNETERRKEAEMRAAQMAADLARIGTVKQEARGMVITLSGSVLFASAKSDLLPDAQSKLSEVANALAKQDPDSKIVVEGHTDSQGGAAFNQDLSQKRAESVRQYLVSHGIAADRVSAQGFGPTRAIADNGSAEGRANNRRVEIVVQASPSSP